MVELSQMWQQDWVLNRNKMRQNYPWGIIRCTLFLSPLLFYCHTLLAQAEVSGELRIWHTVSILFDGPDTSEENPINPFLDYRLNVLFTSPSGAEFTVPGFYAADGMAGDTGATAGNKWAVRFTPNETGNWTYTSSFRTGPGVAILLDPASGTSVSFDGTSGILTISANDKEIPDLRASGRLNYVGERYPRFEGSGKYFIKVGADSPENLLAHKDFDNAVTTKDWAAHIGDWEEGDPVWHNDKGKGLIGAINYLAEMGMNVFSFTMFNLDDPDTFNDGGQLSIWPWSSTDIALMQGSGEPSVDSRMRYDVSKLEQWEIVFSHGEHKGMFLHFKTQERGNLKLLDDGYLGDQRKLYYREIIARFGHHLALNWNLGEEFHIYDAELVNSLSAYIKAVDPYDHPIVLHTFPGQQERMYNPLLGTTSGLTGASLQIDIDLIHKEVRKWNEASKNSGAQWLISSDEQGHWKKGVAVDADYEGDHGTVPDNRIAIRHKALWGTLMAGGFGVEYYFGTETGETDDTSENWRSRETKWEDGRIALAFFNSHIPFWEMEPNDSITSVSYDYCLSKKGEAYAIYLPTGGSTDVDLTGAPGDYNVFWYDPRNGGDLVSGSILTLKGGGLQNTGLPPENVNLDWVAFIEKIRDTTVSVSGLTVSPNSLTLNVGESSTLSALVMPENATDNAVVWTSDTSSVVTVDQYGTIIASGEGTAIVSVRTVEGDFLATSAITVLDPPDPVHLPPFTLVDAESNTDLFNMEHRMEIPSEEIADKKVTIRANMAGVGIDSISMILSGPIRRTWTEDVAPYSLFGDIAGDYSGRLLNPGSYSLVATAYGAVQQAGKEDTTVTIQFTILAPDDEVTPEETVIQTNNDILYGSSDLQARFLKLHPNPAINYVNAEVTDPSITLSNIYIYDLNGSLVMYCSRPDDLLVQDEIYQLETSSLAAGVYLVRIETEAHRSYHYKLLVRDD